MAANKSKRKRTRDLDCWWPGDQDLGISHKDVLHNATGVVEHTGGHLQAGSSCGFKFYNLAVVVVVKRVAKRGLYFFFKSL